MPNIISSKHLEIEKLYLSGQPILKIAKHFSVSPKVILSAMKKPALYILKTKIPHFLLKELLLKTKKKLLCWASPYIGQKAIKPTKAKALTLRTATQK